MALFTIKPTRLDAVIANEVAAHTNSGAEHLAQALTWGADEHVLVALSAAVWLYARARRLPSRDIADHLLVTNVASAMLPHLLKSLVDQIRPDRVTAIGNRNGVPLSGRSCDAFPSGHAVHMGALASAAGLLPRGRRHLARSIAVALSLTRIALLAHWTTDVATGFALGVAVERLLRPRKLAARVKARGRP